MAERLAVVGSARPLAADRVERLLAPVRGRREGVLDLDGRRVRLGHLDKRLFPSGETKFDLLRYFLRMAPLLLAHLADRPLTLRRYPDGVDRPGFFQKNVPVGAPAWLVAAPVGATRYPLARTFADLALFAQWAAVEMHVPPARLGPGGVGAPRVDQLVIDLDPMPPAAWPEARRAARAVRLLLEAAGVRGYPKLSGQTGLHVYVPVAPPGPAGPSTARVARALGRVLVRAAPEVYTIAWSVARRRGVYVDYNQNAPGHTMAAVYGVRAGAGAPVSTPLAWDEIETADPGRFTLHTVPDRVERVGDLFAPTLGPPEPIEALAELVGARQG